MKRWSIFIVMLALSITACTTRLAYDYLDWIINWRASEYVSLDNNQQAQFDTQLQQRLAWHRKTQLPLYRQFIDDLARELSQQSLTANTLQIFYGRYEELWAGLITPVSRDLATVLNSLTNEQIDGVFAKFKKDNAALREEYVDKSYATLQLQRVNQMQQRIEKWTDTLDQDQIETITTWARTIKPLAPRWIEQRIRWQNQLRNILQQFRNTPQLEPALLRLFNTNREEWPEDYRRDYQYNVTLTQKMIVTLHAKLTKKQHAHLQQKLNELSADFQNLMQNH